MTPRRPRQRQQQPSSSQVLPHLHLNPNPHPDPHPLNQVQNSDIESEAIYTQPIPTRTNTDLNLTVLRRYHPSISSILAISASAQVYTFARDTQSWDRANIEGTLFICQLAPAAASSPDIERGNNADGTEHYCIVVLNRKGLDNLIVDMREFQDVEVKGEILILVVKATRSEERRDLGLFIAADGEAQIQSRELNCLLIRELWERSERGGEREEGRERDEEEGVWFAEGNDVRGAQRGGDFGLAMGAALQGRRLSLTELFRQQSSG